MNPASDLGENSKVRPLARGDVGGGDQQEMSENELPYEEKPDEDGLGELTSRRSSIPSWSGEKPVVSPRCGSKPGAHWMAWDFGVLGSDGSAVGSWATLLSLKGIPMVKDRRGFKGLSERWGGCFRIRAGRFLLAWHNF